MKTAPAFLYWRRHAVPKDPYQGESDIAYWETFCQTDCVDDCGLDPRLHHNRLILNFYIFAG